MTRVPRERNSFPTRKLREESHDCTEDAGDRDSAVAVVCIRDRLQDCANGGAAGHRRRGDVCRERSQPFLRLVRRRRFQVGQLPGRRRGPKIDEHQRLRRWTVVEGDQDHWLLLRAGGGRQEAAWQVLQRVELACGRRLQLGPREDRLRLRRRSRQSGAGHDRRRPHHESAGQGLPAGRNQQDRGRRHADQPGGIRADADEPLGAVDVMYPGQVWLRRGWTTQPAPRRPAPSSASCCTSRRATPATNVFVDQKRSAIQSATRSVASAWLAGCSNTL